MVCQSSVGGLPSMDERECCPICFERTMYLQGGHLICATCGTQSQVG